nr:MAG: capsid protein [Virus sp.]
MATKRRNPFGGRSRRFRKRPFMRRKPFRRTRRTQGFASTTRWGRPHSTNYKGRKISGKRWRNIIWRDTIAQPHYRALNSGMQPLTGAALGTPNAAAVFLFPALQIVNGIFQGYHSAGNSFWEGASVQQMDVGVVPPLFKGDIILRGGIARLMIGMYPENVSCRIKVYAVWANKNPDADLYVLLNNTNQQVEWDPSVAPDFSTKFGKILYQKEAMLPVGENFEITHRFRPQKIDQAVFRGEAPVVGLELAGNQLWWCVVVVPLTVNGISDGLVAVNSWNLSFSADAIGTT